MAARLFGALVVGSLLTAFTASAAMAETRSLKLYYVHTGEKAEIVYKRNGRYDQAGLQKLNRFLRDWRRNEPTKMDPRLFDVVWEVYRQTGARDYIHVVSAYRSPATNEMLRRTRGGQAKKSQHMLGKAMDFYIPGVKLQKLREAGMKLQGGGVGYYPRSGSPFVHLDVGGVRAWPRMTRQELVRLFPNGQTLHLPADGKPLPGYEVALAEYKKRGGAIPSLGGSSSGSASRNKSPNLLAALFGGGDEGDDAEEAAASAAPVPAPKAAPAETEVAALPGVEAAPAAAAAAAPTPQALVPARAPIPVARPRIEPQVSEVALVAPPNEVPAQAQIDAFAAAAAAPATASATALPDLSKIRAPIPQFLAERAPKPAMPTEMAALAPPAAVPDPVSDLIAANVPTPAAAPVPAATPAGETAMRAADEPAFIPLPIRRPGDAPAAAKPAGEAPVALASLEPAPVKRGGRVSPVFESPTAARKGARPGLDDAAEGQTSVRRTAPVLTETIISQWALTRGRTQTMSDPATRGKRFVVSQLRAAPKEVYAGGFSQSGDAQPHDKFTGSAVNFIQVARFTRAN
jgi:Uncharacterized protein conserved in bacteria